MTRIIAHRRYFSDSDNVTVAEIEIEAPEPVPDITDEFICRFTIRKQNSKAVVHSTRGIDEIQALLLALVYIRGDMTLFNDSLKGKLRWTGGRDGEVGIELPDIAR